MSVSKIVFCPECKKPVEAKDYLNNSAVVAFLDSVLPNIGCSCGYNGLPLELPFKDYKKLVKKS